MARTPGDAVVITGCGWITPFAAGSISEVLTVADAAYGVESTPISARAAALGSHGSEGFRAVPEQCVNDYPEFSKELKLDKGAWITAAALIHACRDASLRLDSLDADRTGMVLGCGLAGQQGMIRFACEVREQSPRFASPIHFPQTVGNYIAGALARCFKIRGPNLTLAAGPASGLAAVVEGCTLLVNGSADVIVAGGTQCLSDALAVGLAGADTIPSEGACLFMLEAFAYASARGARVLAKVAGWKHSDEGDTAFAVPGGAARPSSRSSPIVSTAGWRRPGAIFIEHWVGACLGAAGSAAAAAAIGARAGHNVPVAGTTDPNSVSIQKMAVGEPNESSGDVPAVIAADANGAERAVLEIVIPATLQ